MPLISTDCFDSLNPAVSVIVAFLPKTFIDVDIWSVVVPLIGDVIALSS